MPGPRVLLRITKTEARAVTHQISKYPAYFHLTSHASFRIHSDFNVTGIRTCEWMHFVMGDLLSGYHGLVAWLPVHRILPVNWSVTGFTYAVPSVYTPKLESPEAEVVRMLR